MKLYWGPLILFVALMLIQVFGDVARAQEAPGKIEPTTSTENVEPYLQAWLSGHDVSHHQVLGIKIYILGRLGHFLLFVAGLSLVLDILREEGLAKLGEWIGTTSLHQNTIRGFKDAWRYVVNINRATYGRLPDSEVDALSQQAFRYLVRPLSLLVMIVLFVLFLWLREWMVVSWLTLLGLSLSIALAPAVMLILNPIISVPGLIVDVLVIKPLSVILKMKDAEQRLRIVMLCSLIAGFIMDILSSVPA